MNATQWTMAAVAALALVVPASLPATALPAAAETVLKEKSCPWENNSGGMWGQDGSCTFVCQSPAGVLTGEVDAVDRDAKVAVTATCGDNNGHCSDEDQCTILPEIPYRVPGKGACSGSSSEVFDDGLYINCWTNGEDTSAAGGDECLVKEPTCVENPLNGAEPTLPTLRLPLEVLENRSIPWSGIPDVPETPEIDPDLVPHIEAPDAPSLPQPDLDLASLIATLCGQRAQCEGVELPEEVGLFAPRAGALIQVIGGQSFAFICPGQMQECTLAQPAITLVRDRLVYAV